jgi:hypothetical protein
MPRHRVSEALVEDEPSFEPMCRNERVAHHARPEMVHHQVAITRILHGE